MPFVMIDWIEGRSDDKKRAIVKEITDTLTKHADCAPEQVAIIFTEHSRANIAKAGQLLSDK
jgi:4-oxalocrotonate tautomerase